MVQWSQNRRSTMKKLIAVLALATASTSAFEGYHGGYGGYYGGYHGGYYHGGGVNWVAPALIGGVIGYELAQPRYVQPAPTVIYQQAPTVYQNCTAWVESVDQYGNVTRTRTCY